MEQNKAVQEKVYANPEVLKDLAMFLEGMKFGRGGDIQPMGTIVLDELWKVVKELRFHGKIEAQPLPTNT